MSSIARLARTRETITAALSKWWGRNVRAAGLVEPKKVIHPFRRTVKVALREAPAHEQIARAIIGHEGAQTYGAGYSLARLNEGQRRLQYPDLDLSHLRRDQQVQALAMGPSSVYPANGVAIKRSRPGKGTIDKRGFHANPERCRHSCCSLGTIWTGECARN